MEKIFISLLGFMLFASCTSDLDNVVKTKVEQEEDIVLLNLPQTKSSNSNGNNILKFKNENVFNETVNKLQFLSNQERLEWEKQMNFESLNSVYEKALDEVTAMEDVTAEEYYSLKKTYQNSLYFPEYKEDYGFYLPVSREEMASVLNRNGEVMIGEEILNLKDIFDYYDLQLTGKALYDLEIQPRLGNKDYIGAQYDSGWKELGNRKFKLKAGRRIMDVKKTELTLHLEISFRKRGAFGWMNYRETTQTSGFYSPFLAPAPGAGKFYKEETGRSSHDHYIERGNPILWEVAQIDSNGQVIKKRGVRITGNFTVKFVGFNYTQNYAFDLPAQEF